VTLAVPRLVAATKRLLEKGEVTIPGHGSITSKVPVRINKIDQTKYLFRKIDGFVDRHRVDADLDPDPDPDPDPI
jgi:hypothetical protein